MVEHPAWTLGAKKAPEKVCEVLQHFKITDIVKRLPKEKQVEIAGGEIAQEPDAAQLERMGKASMFRIFMCLPEEVRERMCNGDPSHELRAWLRSTEPA